MYSDLSLERGQVDPVKIFAFFEMEVTAKVLVVFFLFGIFYVMSEEIVEERQCNGNAYAYVANQVTEVNISDFACCFLKLFFPFEGN